MNYKIKNYLRTLSNRNPLMKKLYSQANEIKVKNLSHMSDLEYAKYKYKENTGNKLNIENPKTFNEKIWWLKVNNKDPLLTVCSDKYRVREYVTKNGLENILIPLYGVFDSPNDIDFNLLPDKAFIKTNNSSGINYFWDRSKYFDEKWFVKKFNKALKSNYYLQSREWNYKHIEPKIIIEDVISDSSEVGLVDYRFLCFSGKVKLIFADVETAAIDGSHNPDAKRNIYDCDFNYLNDLKVKRDKFDPALLPKPRNFEEMKEYAEILSKPFEFCRVDLYNINGKIYFGEITFYPGGGTQLFEPSDWELKVGKWINLGSEKIVINKDNQFV
jgi:hypothetical protein